VSSAGYYGDLGWEASTPHSGDGIHDGRIERAS
jgi:hypothetical protein